MREKTSPIVLNLKQNPTSYVHPTLYSIPSIRSETSKQIMSVSLKILILRLTQLDLDSLKAVFSDMMECNPNATSMGPSDTNAYKLVKLG